MTVNNVNSFSGEVGLYGTARLSDGQCWNAEPFDLKGKHYPKNTIMAVVTGSVTKRKIRFDPGVGLVNLDGRDVSVTKGHHQGNRQTFFWKPPQFTCESSVQQIYQGPAMHVIPRNKKLHEQLMVNNTKRSITFALDLTKSKRVCGSNMYQTQMSNIFVATSPNQFLRKVEETIYVERIDNIIGY